MFVCGISRVLLLMSGLEEEGGGGRDSVYLTGGVALHPRGNYW